MAPQLHRSVIGSVYPACVQALHIRTHAQACAQPSHFALLLLSLAARKWSLDQAHTRTRPPKSPNPRFVLGAGKFNQFYESCPVLQAETPEQQRSRMALCGVTASVLQLSLGLLGINTQERL